MATSKDFMTYVSDQLSVAGELRCRAMFGEYGFYLDGKFLGVVCDNTVYLKPTRAGAALLVTPVLAPPYEGAKDYFLLENLEDREQLSALLRATWTELPWPKGKNR